MIDKRSPIPVYFQLKNFIKDDIKKRELKPGDPILSESKYCEMFKISRMTVRQALNELQSEGVIVRERGKGSFVAIPRIKQKGIMSFTHMVENKGMKPSTQIINLEEIVDSNIEEILKIEKEEKILVMTRIRKADNFPVALETIYIPVKFVPGIKNKNLEGSFYALLKNEYNIEIKSSETNFSAVMSDEKLEEMLELEESMPLLKLESVNYYLSPVYYEISYYKSDEFDITVDFNS